MYVNLHYSSPFPSSCCLLRGKSLLRSKLIRIICDQQKCIAYGCEDPEPKTPAGSTRVGPLLCVPHRRQKGGAWVSLLTRALIPGALLCAKACLWVWSCQWVLTNNIRRDARTQTSHSEGALLGTLFCVLAYRCVIYWSTVKSLSGWHCSLVCLRTNSAHVTARLSLLTSTSLRLFPAPSEHPVALINTDWFILPVCGVQLFGFCSFVCFCCEQCCHERPCTCLPTFIYWGFLVHFLWNTSHKLKSKQTVNMKFTG